MKNKQRKTTLTRKRQMQVTQTYIIIQSHYATLLFPPSTYITW